MRQWFLHGQGLSREQICSQGSRAHGLGRINDMSIEIIAEVGGVEGQSLST